MDAALREFRQSLCAEHLDDSAALHDIAQAIREDREADWLDAGAFEDRAAAHLDALLIGGDSADIVCDAALAAGDDAGACHAAAAVFALRSDRQRVQGIVDRIVAGSLEVPVAEAIASAWIEHLPPSIEDVLLAGVSADIPQEPMPLWRVLSARRRDSQGALGRALARASKATIGGERGHWALLGLMVAAGRCADRIDPEALAQFFDHDDPAISSAALTAGLRRGGAAACARLEDVVLRSRVAPMLQAVAGDADAALSLVMRLQRKADSQTIDALGVCGHLGAVRPLVDCLSDDGLAANAARALHLLTGIAPMETCRIEDPVDEDELFERERERWLQQGLPPRAGDGLPYGRNVSRLSHDPAVWRDELHRASDRFAAGLRYRFGQPYSLQVLLQGLQRPAVAQPLRTAFIEEAMIRHGLDLRIDGPAPVRRQLKRLTSHRILAAADAEAVQPGA